MIGKQGTPIPEETTLTFNDKVKLTIESAKIINPKIIQLDKVVNSIPSHELIKPNFRFYESHINKNKSSLAYVTFIILDDSYLPAILNLGFNLRNLKVNYKLVCIAQDKEQKIKIGKETKSFPGISISQIQEILEIFDEVVGVDLLSISEYSPVTGHFTCSPTYQNIAVYATKAQLLGLVKYKKIFYIDASVIFEKNIDYIFDKYNQSAFANDPEWTQSKVGYKGGFMFYVPKLQYYNKALFLIHNYTKIFENLFIIRGVDETIIYYSIYPYWSKETLPKNLGCSEFYGRIPFYNYDPKKGKRYCKFYHFQFIKPFRLHPQNIEKNKKNVTYINFKKWDEEAKKLLSKYPQFKKYFTHIKEHRYTWF
jgi:hypothetical protein